MNRLVVLGAFILAFSGAYQLGSTYEHTEEEAQNIMDQFMELIEDIDGIGIFLHNLMITAPMFIPGFGVVWSLFVAWTTGVTLSAILLLTPTASEISPLSLLFMTPFGIMEVTSYSLAGSRSFLLALRIYHKQSLRPTLRVVSMDAAIVVGLLLAGGLIEHHIIQAELGGTFLA